MVYLASLLSQLLVAGTLVVALGLGAAVAYFYVQARRREAAEAEREAHEVKQRDSELSHIRERIEEIYERQQTGSETQFARVDQQLEELQSHLDAKGRQIDGVQGQMRYELERHGDEIAELRNQLREAIEVFAAAALPAAQPAAPALEAHVEPTPAPQSEEPPANSPHSVIYAPKAEEPTDEAPALTPVDNHLKDDHELLEDLFGGTNLDSGEADETESDPVPATESPLAVETPVEEELAEEEAAPKGPLASGVSFVTREVVDLTGQAEPRDDLAFVDLSGSAPQTDAWDAEVIAEVEPALDAASAPLPSEDDIAESDVAEDTFAEDTAEPDDQTEDVTPSPVQWAALDSTGPESEAAQGPVDDLLVDANVEDLTAAETSTETDDLFEAATAHDAAETDPEDETFSPEAAVLPDTPDASPWENLNVALPEAEDLAPQDNSSLDAAAAAEAPSDEATSDDAFADVEIEADAGAPEWKDQDEESAEDAADAGNVAPDFTLETGSPFDPFGMDTHDVPEPLPTHSGDGMSAPDFDAETFDADAFDADPFSDASPDYHPEPTTDLDSFAEPAADLSDLAFDASELGPTDAADDAPLPVAPGEGEDLTILTVVDGPMQERLYALGITTIEAIARWSRSDARRIADQLTHTSEEDIMDRWVFEAQSILFERYQDELRGQRQQRLNAN